MSGCDSIIGITDITAAADANTGEGGTPDATVDQATDAPQTQADTSPQQGDSQASSPEAGMDSSSDAGEGGMEGGGCAPGMLTCDGGCVPNDPHNCGTCGNDCTNLMHVSGQVACGAGGTCEFDAGACASGYAHCSGPTSQGCETQITTPTHCGMCGSSCKGGTPDCSGSGSTYSCTSGCSTPTPTPCGSSCVDTTTDPNNCGTCGSQCTTTVNHADPTCSNSACGYACKTGYNSCKNGCVDYSSDNNNCGGCGNVCGTGTVCSSGTCVCNTTSGCGGCCNGNVCEPLGSQSTTLCGNDGATCGSCSITGQTCQSSGNGGSCQCPSGESVCGSGCTSTQTDWTNCGTCGHNCLGGTGTCALGACQAFELSPSPSGIASITGLTTDGSKVYWTGLSTGTASDILSCANGGCNKTPTVLVNSAETGQLITYGGALYWTAHAVGAGGHAIYGVYTCPVTGCATESPAATGITSPAVGLATNGTFLYWWPSTSALDVATLPGGAATQFVAATSGADAAYGVAYSPHGSGYVYWIDSGNVDFAPAVGVASTGTAASSNASSGAGVLAADSSNVYWSGSTGVWQCAAGSPGCASSTAPLMLASGAQGANSIASDGTYVYWPNGSGSIVRATVGVGNPTPIAVNQSGAGTIAVDSKAVYWSVNGAIVMAIAK
jgi:hypothetical protein